MKYLIGALLTLSFSISAFATVDGLTQVSIVHKDVNSEEFRLINAPVMGCYGLAQGPQLEQWTKEYLVKGNIGCGGIPQYEENLNYLTCAKVLDSSEDETSGIFKEITLDISKCADKDNKQFITMVRTSAARNFPQSKKTNEVKLNLVK